MCEKSPGVTVTIAEGGTATLVTVTGGTKSRDLIAAFVTFTSEARTGDVDHICCGVLLVLG
jgi:hypothetical protein